MGCRAPGDLSAQHPQRLGIPQLSKNKLRGRLRQCRTMGPYALELRAGAGGPGAGGGLAACTQGSLVCQGRTQTGCQAGWVHGDPGRNPAWPTQRRRHQADNAKPSMVPLCRVPLQDGRKEPSPPVPLPAGRGPGPGPKSGGGEEDAGLVTEGRQKAWAGSRGRQGRQEGAEAIGVGPPPSTRAETLISCQHWAPAGSSGVWAGSPLPRHPRPRRRGADPGSCLHCPARQSCLCPRGPRRAW